MSATINDGWKLALEDAFDGERVGTHEKRARDEEEWKVGNGDVVWASSSWGSVKVENQSGFRFGPIQRKDRFTVAAPILLRGKETQIIPFCIEAVGANGIRVLRTQDDRMEDVTDNVGHHLPTWRIQVSWDNGIPRTVPSGATDADNFDLVFLDSDGCFREMELSATTRAGKFWFAIQEKSAGQVVRTTPAKAMKLGVTTVEVEGFTCCFVAPLYPQNAYQGADWLKTSGEVGQKVVGYAIRRGASVPLSKCHVAEWVQTPVNLEEKLKANGWKVATVEWFNAVLGWGFSLCHDRIACFCHFKQIIDINGKPLVSNGEFPILTPMCEIALKWKDESDGKGGIRRRATAIRIL